MELVQSANLKDKASGRVAQVDVLRGFALLGIGLENLFSMHTTNALFAEYSAKYDQGLNHFLLIGLMVLVRGKFYPIFSFVFGVSAALGLPYQGQRYFLRRLGGLFLLGVLQILFIWEGDVLVQYAFMGGLLLLLRNWNASPLVGIGIFLFLFSFMGEVWNLPVHQASQRELSVYGVGTFQEMIVFRIQEYLQSIITWPALLFYSRIFAFMLFGFAFVKSKSLHILTSPVRLGKVFMMHLALAAGIALVVQVVGWRGETGDNLWAKELSLGLYFYAAVVCLAVMPLILSQLPKLRRLLLPLQGLGKVTLTHYLTQNLLFSLLFYRYGLGLFYELQPWQCVLLYLVLIAGQLSFTAWLLKRYKQGPVEYLLRWMAGRKEKGVS